MNRISEFDKRITLIYPTVSKDTLGTPVTTWTDGATIWAKKTTHRSDESVQAMATTGTATHNYRIRYRTDVKSNWKIRHGNKTMTIIGPPVEVGRREFLDITVKEVT